MKKKKSKKINTSKSANVKTRRKKAGRKATKKAIKRAPKKGARKKAKRPAPKPPEESAGGVETTVVYEVIETQAFEQPHPEADSGEEEEFGR
jgi:hypothetical protein